MRKTCVLRRLPSGATTHAPVPKSTWASSPAWHFHPAKRQRPPLDEPSHETLYAVVLAGESVVRHEVLPNPLRGKLLVELGLNDLAVRLALAAAARR